MNVIQIGDIIHRLDIGDQVIINDWEYPFTVLATSEHFVVVYHRSTDEYSIISKTLSEHSYNSVRAGTYYCGPDNFIFSSFSPAEVASYLSRLEDPNDTLEISHKRRATIDKIVVQ